VRFAIDLPGIKRFFAAIEALTAAEVGLGVDGKVE
jgi:hypothetical protein